MRRSLRFLSVVFPAIIMAACSAPAKREKPNEIYFTEHITVYPADAFTPDTISGVALTEEIIGALRLHVGNGLIAIETPQDDPMVKIFTIGGDFYGAFCHKGQGPDDFYNVELSRPFTDEAGDTCIWVNDVSSKKLKRLNLSQSRRDGMTRVDSAVVTEFGAINAMIAGNILVYEVMDNNAYKLKYRNLTNPADTLHTEQMYVYPTEDFYAFYSSMSASSDGRHIASGMGYFNQLNILSLLDMSRRAVSVGNLMAYADCYDSQKRSEKFVAYGNVCAADGEIYAIYYGIPANTDWPECTTIHVVDYDANLQRVLATRESLRDVSFDDATSTLYGLDRNEQIYKYALK